MQKVKCLQMASATALGEVRSIVMRLLMPYKDITEGQRGLHNNLNHFAQYILFVKLLPQTAWTIEHGSFSSPFATSFRQEVGRSTAESTVQLLYYRLSRVNNFPSLASVMPSGTRMKNAIAQTTT
jgi:hypothetical protein